MIIGIGGNNGVSLVPTLLPYNKNLTWETKNGHHVKFFGSISQFGSKFRI